MGKGWLAASVCALVVLGSCGTGESPVLEEPSPTATNEARSSTRVAVAITEPADGSTVPAGGVKVSATPTNFDIPADGHIHFYIDTEIPTTAGKPAFTSDSSKYHAGSETAYTWPDVKAGEHTFGVQLVNSDHTPLDPPVTASVTVTVE
jgi:hypothetical protein